MKDTDKTGQSYLHDSSSLSGLSPRSHLNNILNNALQQPGQEMLYPSVTPAAVGEFTPDMYAHYMYMYNYMYMQQQLAWTSSVLPADPYGVLGSGALPTNSLVGQGTGKASVCHQQKARDTGLDNVESLKNVHQHHRNKTGKAGLSAKHEQTRFQPYSRPSQAAVESKAASSSKKNNNTSQASPVGGSTGENVNKSEERGKSPDSLPSPLDLSRKTEKLEYLNMLKHLIESSDKRTVSSLGEGVKRQCLERKHHKKSTTITSEGSSSVRTQGPFHQNSDKTCKTPTQESLDNKDRSESPNLNKDSGSRDDNSSTSLTSKKDKLEFLSVLKELFEKGHSTTSQNILGEEKMEKSVVDNSHKSSVCLESLQSEDSLDDLSVDQSLVIRKKQNL